MNYSSQISLKMSLSWYEDSDDQLSDDDFGDYADHMLETMRSHPESEWDHDNHSDKVRELLSVAHGNLTILANLVRSYGRQSVIISEFVNTIVENYDYISIDNLIAVDDTYSELVLDSAVLFDNIEIARYIMEKSAHSMGSYMINESLLDAVRNHNIDMVNLILDHPLTDASVYHNLPIVIAARNKDYAILELLLARPEITLQR
jgi:hypothetical protein